MDDILEDIRPAEGNNLLLYLESLVLWGTIFGPFDLSLKRKCIPSTTGHLGPGPRTPRSLHPCMDMAQD